MNSKLPLIIICFLIGFGVAALAFSNRADTSEETLQPVPASQIACMIDSFTDGEQGSMVPVTITKGNLDAGDLEAIEYRGFAAQVIYNEGDEQEPQTFLGLTIGRNGAPLVYSTMYDYNPVEKSGPINVLHYDGEEEQLRLQCWIDE